MNKSLLHSFRLKEFDKIFDNVKDGDFTFVHSGTDVRLF